MRTILETAPVPLFSGSATQHYVRMHTDMRWNDTFFFTCHPPCSDDDKGTVQLKLRALGCHPSRVERTRRAVRTYDGGNVSV